MRDRFTLVFLLAGSLLACSSALDESAIGQPLAAGLPSYLVSFEGVSARSQDETRSSSLRAETLVYRNRRGGGGFISYYDLADLLVSDARFSITLKTAISFSAIPETIASLLTPDPEDPEIEGENQFDDGPAPAIVTRLVFEQLAIDLVGPGVQISLEAGHGQYDLRSGTLALDGQIVIRTSQGQEIEAPNAVLSRDHDGLYMPFGHTRGGRKQAGASFVVANDQGRLSVTPAIDPIAYEDLIEERERIVLHHYMGRVPPALKPLLIAILAGMGPDRP